jgi:hypothetical protein
MRGALWQIEQKDTTPPWTRRDNSQADVDIIHSESDHLVEAKITACLEGDRMLSSSFSLRVFLSPALSLKLAKTLNRKWNLVILLP